MMRCIERVQVLAVKMYPSKRMGRSCWLPTAERVPPLAVVSNMGGSHAKLQRRTAVQVRPRSGVHAESRTRRGGVGRQATVLPGSSPRIKWFATVDLHGTLRLPFDLQFASRAIRRQPAAHRGPTRAPDVGSSLSI